MKKLFAVLLAVLMVAVMATAMAETTLKVAGWDITTTPYYTAIKEGFEAATPPTCTASRSSPICRTGPRKASSCR